ncbi:Glycosyltransferase [Methanosarcina sp. MTP4]|uniref:glycosyltransferase family 4 protein n=1 Tax=Methanosarcina sp. MTP4 TaxID=1434100 RepID=UPI000615AE7D|nr:glycosyltransferase family 4 protein [Methanosarcina sp. MTP4]AKB24196.1 Glycosyltransferase [Methanosarcina sp. MTP4]
MAKKKKVIFVHAGTHSFIQQDIEILKNNFDTRCIDVGRKKTNLYQKIKLVTSIVREILWADVAFAWFANNHAYAMVKLAKLLGKKSIVVIGGFEVACEPEIRYGALLEPVLAKRVKYILNNADKIISVSKFSENDILKTSKPKKLKVIHNSIDTNKFRSDQKKEDIVITIGNSTNARCKLKGIDTFVKASAKFPSTKFVVIGDYDIPILKKLKEIQPNVHFTGLIPHEEVALWLKKAKVYCQLSYYESFGVALIEAMSCECVPVITERGAMSEVAGDTGFVVPYGDPEATAEAIKKALLSKNGPSARQRVMELFDTEERERKLVETIRSMS